MSELLQLDDRNFDDEILKSETPAAVLFKSIGCPHCVKMVPVMEELADEYSGRVKLAILDVSAGQDKAIEYGVLSVPRLFLFKNGQKVEEFVGAVSKEKAAKKIEELLQ